MTDEGPAKSPSQAVLDASAEIGIETMRQRRWIFLIGGLVVATVFPIIGTLYAMHQPGIESVAFGGAFIVAGLLGGAAAWSSFRKVNGLIDRYNQNLDNK